MPDAKTEQPPTDKNPNILYVVLHGLITLIDLNSHGFCAHLLEMNNEHRYLYGTWLVEEEIPPRAKGQPPFRAELKGATKGNKELNPELNVIVKLKDVPPDVHKTVRATIKLPRPQDIHYFISGDVDQELTGDALALLEKKPRKLSGIRVFEYMFEDPAQVFLAAPDGTRLWDCPSKKEELARLPNQNVAVLHIYDEPGDKLSDTENHNKEEFKLSSDFLGVSLSLTKSIAADILPATDQSPIPGLLLGEIAALERRKIFVNQLLVTDRTGLPPIVQSPDGGGGTGGQVCSGGNAKVVPPSPSQG